MRVTPSHTKKVFANMKRQGKDFSGRDIPLYLAMIVQVQEQEGEEPMADETENVESVPTHSNDPLLSGEERLKLNELMELYTNWLKRLRKIGRSAQVVSSKDEGLGAQEDASKQERKFADLDADIEEVEVEKVVSTAEVTTASATTTTVDELTLAHTLIEIKAAKPKVVTTVATMTTIAVTRPKARRVVVQEPSEFTTTTSPLQPSQLQQDKDKGKAKMVEPEKPLKKNDQILIDEEIAQRLQEELQAEIEEEERLARQKEEEANIALIESWDNTQAMMDAEEQEELTIEERSKLFNANVTRWQPIYANEQEEDDDHNSYSLMGFAWAFKTRILDSFRVEGHHFYRRDKRYPRVVAWRSNKKFYRHMLCGFFHGRRPTSTLSPNEFEARSDWWVSSRGYFDGHIHKPARIPCLVNQHTQDDVLVDYYRRLEEHDRALKELMQKDAAPKQMYNKMNNFMEQTPMSSHPATLNWQNPMPQPGYVPWSSQYGSSHHRDVGLVNLSPFTGLPPTTVLSKKRGDKSRNKGTNPDVAPFNLENAIVDDNVVVEEVMITGACQTDDYIVYENVDPSKQMNAWIELLIRERPHDARWRVAKSRATSLHPRSNQFIIQTNPHIIGTLDGSTHLYPSWNDVDWVYMPINAGGDHWVTGAVNLPNFRFYVFDSLHSEFDSPTLFETIRNWTNVVKVIFQSHGCFQGTGRQPYNFQQRLLKNTCWTWYLKLQAEFDEEERLVREKAEKEKETNIALIEEWDDIQEKINVDYQLAERLPAQEQEELSDAERATLFQQLLKKRRKHFAAKRA
ncbi:phospholipase-like protein [Tanacetum coccineum]|uniref:Phospholipase-like protein n=1 Tax=Tanacetum coccineum TaxID=301880 RepID=A0ABQ4Y563_9ASTR